MKSEITIKTVRCKGCGICAAFCPKSVLARQDQRAALASCAAPDYAIFVDRVAAQ